MQPLCSPHYLVGLLVDTIMATKYQFYLLDKPGIQIPPLIGQIVLYASTNVIILNLFPYEKPIRSKGLFILTFTLLAVGFELLSYKFGLIKYNEWKPWYSAISYPFLIYLLVIHYKFFQWISKEKTLTDDGEV